jgi:hypothetical protein
MMIRNHDASDNVQNLCDHPRVEGEWLIVLYEALRWSTRLVYVGTKGLLHVPLATLTFDQMITMPLVAVVAIKN